ncbi:MAG: hypothetical protein E7319_06845 [Clostridiales bacterium]|nr:hypothetical protein [Clostridiales bacterium]
MKKTIVSLFLVLAMVLGLCSGASAAMNSFDFTLQEYVDSYGEFCSTVLGSEVTWAAPVDTDDGLTGIGGSAEGMSDVYAYSVTGETACVGIGSQLNVNLNDSAAISTDAQAFGMSVAATTFAIRYLELGNDIIALSGELSDIQAACTTLVQDCMSSDALTAAMSEPYVKTIEVAGHTAQMTVSVDIDAMTMQIMFILIP